MQSLFSNWWNWICNKLTLIPQVVQTAPSSGTVSQQRPKSGLDASGVVASISGVRRRSGPQGLRSPAAKRPLSAPVALQGWLHKQGSEGLMLWKKRWFVLSSTVSSTTKVSLYCPGSIKMITHRMEKLHRFLSSFFSSLPHPRYHTLSIQDSNVWKTRWKLEEKPHSSVFSSAVHLEDTRECTEWKRKLDTFNNADPWETPPPFPSLFRHQSSGCPLSLYQVGSVLCTRGFFTTEWKASPVALKLFE